MAEISISLPDDLLTYIDRKVSNRNALLESLVSQWRSQQEDEAFVEACALVDQLDLGWDEECQQAMITDWGKY